mgnify:CR=1 FL=1
MIHSHRMEVFACRSSEKFAGKVIEHLRTLNNGEEPEIHLGALSVDNFSDGEFQPQYLESVRGATVYIIQSTMPPADNLMELLLAIDAAKRASADKVIAVMPYFGWARQDRKDRPRVAIGAKLVANLLKAAGADRVMTCDLHADQIQGFFDIPVDNLAGGNIFAKHYIKKFRCRVCAVDLSFKSLLYKKRDPAAVIDMSMRNNNAFNFCRIKWEVFVV